ncbi:MAG: hypothetical protein ACYTG6_12145 [Planctomycetota bacterium]|jgi:hypothetical protein
MELYDEYASQRDAFEIFAFHNRSVEDLVDLDERMTDIVEDEWGGRELPFPTLLDSTGLTFRNFSVRTLGTAVLIDPEGNVVRGNAEEILEAALAGDAGEEPAAEEPAAGDEEPSEATEPPPPSPPAETEMRGRVVTQDGSPVAGVRFALQWTFWEDEPRPRWPPRKEPPEVVSDDEGLFTASVDLRYAPLGLVALDMTRRLGARHVIGRTYAGTEIELVLEPLVHVFGTFMDDIPELPLTSSYAYAGIPGVRTGVAEDLGRDSDFSLHLPPGDYNFRFSGTDRQYLRIKVTLDGSRPEHDLGTLVLPPKPISLLYGKEPPALTVTDARGVDPDVQFSDYRGKWLLVEFWGHW